MNQSLEKKKKRFSTMINFIVKRSTSDEHQDSFSKQYQFIILKDEHSRHLSKTFILPPMF